MICKSQFRQDSPDANLSEMSFSKGLGPPAWGFFVFAGIQGSQTLIQYKISK